MSNLNTITLLNVDGENNLYIHCADQNVLKYIPQLVFDNLNKVVLTNTDHILPFLVIPNMDSNQIHNLIELFDHTEVIKNQDEEYVITFVNNTLIFKDLINEESMNMQTGFEDPSFEDIDLSINLYMDFMEGSSETKVRELYNFLQRVSDAMWINRANEVLGD